MELQQKTAVYQSMRGMRAPVVMQKHVGQREPRVSDKNDSKNIMKDLKFIAPEQERKPGQEFDQQQQQEPEQASPLAGFQLLQYGPSVMQGNMGMGPTFGLGPGPAYGASIGRVPLGQDMQFAGVSNGESLWAFPNSQSPEASSDTTSLSGQQIAGGSTGGKGGGEVTENVMGNDSLMADIDWVSLFSLSHSSTWLCACIALVLILLFPGRFRRTFPSWTTAARARDIRVSIQYR